ncbi:MAG: hypothetical protein KAJ20_00030 [Candidatus Aenigmarchaeota archaeon]|nr:hypothetical protein [Candidatus Aenigmarchaeota archaeon]MCK5372707.1 hypothetical protein [Candidatus Aenigmarchaeota archaeon]
MVESVRNEFIELMARNFRLNGFDDLTSKIVGVLYIEPCEISLEKVADKTGYSLSAVSTSMKLLVRMSIIKRIKKPKSRKVYFFMEKDMVTFMLEAMKRKYEFALLASKEALPKIIEKYKSKGNECLNDELKIIEQYYNQIVAFEDVMKNFIEALENLQYEHSKDIS